MKIQHFLFILTFMLVYSSCNKLFNSEEEKPPNISNNMMVVYPNRGNMLYLVDYKTFEVIRKIIVDIPDSLGIFRMCLSTNKNFFVFDAHIEGKPPFSHYIISYNIAQDSIHNIFPTGLDSVGAPRMTAAYISDEPGLIYLYSHNVGLYSIDFLTEEVKTIYTVNDGPGVDFHHSPDKEWIVINKYIPGGMNPGHHEIEFYNTISGLYNPQFILNKNNQDSIQVDDLAFSEDNNEIFISIRLPQMRYIANYFGSYDLETKKLYKSPLNFPWSLNPYYMAYSAKRKECYLVGAQDKFYIVDRSKEDYKLETIIDLAGKVPSPSRILLRPDEDVAFVSCVYSNFVIAIDLDKRQIIRKIEMEYPYLMILL